MKLPFTRPRGHAWLQQGRQGYDITFARLGREIETVSVRADSLDEAIGKAERYLFANIYPLRVNGQRITEYREETR